MTLQLWSDGAVRPTNPGPGGIGVIGYDGDEVVIEIAEYIGWATNNIAEYKAAIAALKAAIDLGAEDVVLHVDSSLVVEQFHRRWKTNDRNLVPLLNRLRGLSHRFKTCKVEWVPREQNREADGLSVAGSYPPPEDEEVA